MSSVGLLTSDDICQVEAQVRREEVGGGGSSLPLPGWLKGLDKQEGLLRRPIVLCTLKGQRPSWNLSLETC